MGEKQTSARASNSTRPMNAMFVRRRTPNRTKAPLANQKVPLILAPVLRSSMHAVCLNLPQPKAACGLRSNRQKINVFHPIHCLPPSSLFRQRIPPSRLAKKRRKRRFVAFLDSEWEQGERQLNNHFSTAILLARNVRRRRRCYIFQEKGMGNFACWVQGSANSKGSFVAARHDRRCGGPIKLVTVAEWMRRRGTDRESDSAAASTDQADESERFYSVG